MVRLEDIRKNAEKLNKDFASSFKWGKDHLETDAQRSAFKSRLEPASREVRRVIRASKKRPSIAIFGQSQVGKSYLVQNLVKSGDSSCLEIIHPGADQKIDFISDLNPDGGRESTGIVTRFSTETTDSEKPTEFPYKVELLGILDIAAILCNSYIKNFRTHELELGAERINTLIKEAEEASSEAVLNTKFDEDDVFHFWRFFKRQFRNQIIFDRINNKIDITTILSHCLPRLHPEQQAKLLSMFWGENKFFTDLCITLLETSSKVDYEREVYVGLDALMPKEDSILDVRTKRRIYENENNTSLKVYIPGKEVKQISRGQFAALVKEITLSIPEISAQNQAQSFLRHTDVLDFPGWKTSLQITDDVFEEKTDYDKLELYIRGKVDYLFDHFNENFGISTLIVCMDNHPPEVQDLPAEIKRWIDMSMGEGREKRETLSKDMLRDLQNSDYNDIPDAVSPLLFAMTKFNVELAGKATDVPGNPSSHDGKWDARFKTNFSDFYTGATNDKWTDHWDGQGSSFKFLFPLRDPEYSGSTFESVDEKFGNRTWRNETGIRPTELGRLEDMGHSFCDSDVVRRFIQEPEVLWEELKSPNGTGISYLCRYLGPASHPLVRNNILKNTLAKQRKSLEEELAKHLVTGDFDTDLKKAQQQGNIASAAIHRISKQHDMLSHLLNELVWKDEVVYQFLYKWRVLSLADNRHQAGQTIEKDDRNLVKEFLGYYKDVISADLPQSHSELESTLEDFYNCSGEALNDILKQSFGIEMSQVLATSDTEEDPSDLDKFLAHVLQHWSNSLIEVSNGFLKHHEKKIDETTVRAIQGLISELVLSRDRCELQKEMHEAIADVYAEQITKDSVHFVSSILAGMLNRYVFTLGYGYVQEEDLPVLRGEKIYSSFNSIREIPEEEVGMLENPGSLNIAQLAMAANHIYMANVRFKYNREDDHDMQANSKLTAIMESLNSAELVA